MIRNGTYSDIGNIVVHTKICMANMIKKNVY